MSWLAAKAEELLNTADKKAGERIERVKEATGIPRTPAVGEDESGPGEGPAIVVLSAAAAALLDPEERERLVSFGTARVADDTEAPPETPSAASYSAVADGDGPSGDDGTSREVTAAARQQQQRRLRVAEWSALQQELQILSMHGRKLQTRLTACAAQLTQARAAEAAAKKELQRASSARSAAEMAASEARGTVEEQLSAAEARVQAAEARAASAERARGEADESAVALQEEIALARAEIARAEDAASMQTAALGSVRLELSSEREQAAQAARVSSNRIRAAEELNEELQRTNEQLSSAVAESARASGKSTVAAADSSAAVARLEAELQREVAARTAAARQEAELVARRRAAEDEAALARLERDKAVEECANAKRALDASRQQLQLPPQSPHTVPRTQGQLGLERSPQAGAAAVDGRAESGLGDAAESEARAAAALAERSATIERLIAERAALKLKLETEGARRITAERQQQQMQQQIQQAAHRIDMPGSGGSTSNHRKDSAGPPPRHVTRWLTSAVPRPRPELLKAANVADDVAEVLDRAALTAGRHLRMHRPLRLGAMCYLALLHCWLLVLLMHMAPTLEPHRHSGVPPGARM